MVPTIPKKIGKYDVLCILGQGGMGTVYKAVDPLIGRTVAIKMVTANLADDSGLLERFHREARANGNLQHPNIVVVYELGEQDGSPYLVMEYLEGESLEVLIKQKRPLTIADKFNLIVEVCRGLQYAHERGVVHRDIKPANLMRLPKGVLKILDFGIARIQNEVNVTLPGQVIGTIPYMSPEQLSGGPVDGQTDVFSTGVVLYQLLTYALPFNGESTGSTVRKIICDPPPPLSNYLQSYPAELEEIVRRVLAKLPEERYTAEALATELVELRERLKREVTVESDRWTIFNSAGLRKLDQANVASAPVAQRREPVHATPPPVVEPVASPEGVLAAAPRRQLSKETLAPSLETGRAASVSTATRRTTLKWVLLAVILIAVLGVVFAWRYQNSRLRVVSNSREGLANSTTKQAGAALPQQITTSTGTMELVPGGEFLMGSDTGRQSREFGYYNEAPAHTVTLPSFYIDQYEVTNTLYKQFCDATGRKYPQFAGRLRDYFSHGDYPVINISWSDARAYAAWAGKRLPTEAEWEKAARGTDGRHYPWGNEINSTVILPPGEVAAPVGSHAADNSPFGVMDMAGNVPEWVEDSYQLYPGNPATLPAQESGQKVVRGVLFRFLNNAETAITNRASAPPVVPEGKTSVIGFRCAADAETALRSSRP